MVLEYYNKYNTSDPIDHFPHKCVYFEHTKCKDPNLFYLPAKMISLFVSPKREEYNVEQLIDADYNETRGWK